jgi:hypothetical protein
MAKKKKRNLKLEASFWITFFVGVTFAYFMWLSWEKLTTMVGNSNVVWAVSGGVVLLAILTGYFSWQKIARRFME